MGRTATAVAFSLLFGAVAYLGAVMVAQQRAIEALVSDQREALKIQHKLIQDLQELRREWQSGR